MSVAVLRNTEQTLKEKGLLNVIRKKQFQNSAALLASQIQNQQANGNGNHHGYGNENYSDLLGKRSAPENGY